MEQVADLKIKFELCPKRGTLGPASSIIPLPENSDAAVGRLPHLAFNGDVGGKLDLHLGAGAGLGALIDADIDLVGDIFANAHLGLARLLVGPRADHINADGTADKARDPAAAAELARERRDGLGKLHRLNRRELAR